MHMLPKGFEEDGQMPRIDPNKCRDIVKEVVEIVSNHNVEGILEESFGLGQIHLHLVFKVRL